MNVCHRSIQDEPGLFDTYIIVLEGTKLVLLLPECTWDVDDPPFVEHVPSEAYLKFLAKKHCKPGHSPEDALVTLGPGEGVLVRPGVWHCVVNLQRCISINISVATSLHVFLVGAAATISRAVKRADARQHDVHRIALGQGFYKALVSCLSSLKGSPITPSLSEPLHVLGKALDECRVHAPNIMRIKSKRAMAHLSHSIRDLLK